MVTEDLSTQFSVLAQEMLQLCQAMQALLEQDATYFVHNQLPDIEASNQKKLHLIEQLNNLLKQLQMHYPQSMLQENVLLPSSVAAALKAEVNKCYKHITLNSELIFTNLNLLKEVWDGLLAARNESHVYERAGQVNKGI